MDLLFRAQDAPHPHVGFVTVATAARLKRFVSWRHETSLDGTRNANDSSNCYLSESNPLLTHVSVPSAAAPCRSAALFFPLPPSCSGRRCCVSLSAASALDTDRFVTTGVTVARL